MIGYIEHLRRKGAVGASSMSGTFPVKLVLHEANVTVAGIVSTWEVASGGEERAGGLQAPIQAAQPASA
jgi:hypothetical protein